MRNPIKIIGGKYLLRKWIISNFPPHDSYNTYIEGFLGGGSILYNKLHSNQEFAFDINENITNFNTVLSTEPIELLNILHNIEYSEQWFEWAEDFESDKNTPVERAAKYLVRNRMSRDGNLKNYTWSDRLRRGKPEQISSWETILSELPILSERIKDVIFYTDDILNSIHEFENESCYGGCFLYLDPPYIPETRTKKIYGKYEQDVQFHCDLLDRIKNAKSKILISGYDNQLYNRVLRDWNKAIKETSVNVGNAKVKSRRIECLWKNY